MARAAIFESGQATTTFSPTRPSRQQDWVHFVEAVPACASLSRTMDTIPCLQKTDSATLLAALSAARSQSNEQFPWGPVIDGTGGMIPDLPSRLLERGAQSKIPFIAGTTLDEGVFRFSSTSMTAKLTRVVPYRNWLHSSYLELHQCSGRESPLHELHSPHSLSFIAR